MYSAISPSFFWLTTYIDKINATADMYVPSMVFILSLVIAILLVVIIVAILGVGRKRVSISSYASRHARYTRGEFTGQFELDLRLPYKRFKELYPESRITYIEYKKIQMERAFRRARSSQENKRMVR